MEALPKITPRHYHAKSYVLNFDSFKEYGYDCGVLHGMVLRSITKSADWIFSLEKRMYSILVARAIEAILRHYNESSEAFLIYTTKDRMARIRGHICYFVYTGSPYSFEEVARVVGWKSKVTAKDAFDRYVRNMNKSEAHEQEMKTLMALPEVAELHFEKYANMVKVKK